VQYGVNPETSVLIMMSWHSLPKSTSQKLIVAGASAYRAGLILHAFVKSRIQLGHS
jgi:glycine/serine hydroxymethyltransferase